MSFREEFLFWRLAHLLISENGYRLLQISKSQKEIWLENTNSKEPQVVRILLHPLDWSTWMQRDIGLTLVNSERVRKQLRKRSLHVFNIYVTPYPPVDDYEFRIHKPAVHPKKKAKVTSIICDAQNGVQNLANLFSTPLSLHVKDEYEESEVEWEKNSTLLAIKEKVKSEKAIFNNAKPVFTYLFMVIQILVFILMEFAGGSTQSAVLIEFGAKVNALILQGDWWRLFTPIFIHIGILHLLMNTLALYYLGMTVERIYGNFRFLFIYVAAGFFGALASLLFSPSISAGASGAIFGCFGALLYFGTIYPTLFKRTMGFNIFIVIAINLIFGFSVSGIDNAGHIGGLIGGYLAAAIVHFPKSKKVLYQGTSLILSLMLIGIAFHYSQNNPGKLIDEQSALILGQTYIQNDEFDEAYTILNKYNEYNSKTVNTLFLLSFSEIKTGRVEEAKNHLHEVIQLEPNFHEAYYNLSLLYYSEEDFLKAKEYASKAVEKQPSNNDYQSLLEEIKEHDSPEPSALGA
ncbi:rhomboid family intramembrane serine protease [Niallia sp. Krafla_26]|uniref:rhomboid family intramembrane serine protease n=1 Tax=Niallia sp. Krafla_26 TaxID=3064703 RepID=UPI003D1725C4